MKNKKLVLLATAAMGFVALGAAGVGTLAWYQVSAQGRVATSNNSADINTVAPEGSVTVSLPLTVALSASPTNLELAHYYDAGDLTANSWYLSTSDPGTYTKQTVANSAGLMTAVHLTDNSKTLVHKASAFGGSNALWADITITLTAPTAGATVNGVAYTQSEIATLLNGKKVDVALARDDASRAMFYYIGTSAASAPTGAGTTSKSDTTGYTLSNLGDGGTVLHFGMYVEGDNSGTVDASTITGDYSVTITQH